MYVPTVEELKGWRPGFISGRKILIIFIVFIYIKPDIFNFDIVNVYTFISAIPSTQEYEKNL